MKGSPLFFDCVMVISLGGSLAITCPNDDCTVNSWLCGLQNWAKSIKEWKNRIEVDCSEEDLGSDWNDLFTCSGSITVTCCDGTKELCERNDLNCDICHCTDGKYAGRPQYNDLYKKYLSDFRKALALYDEELRYCGIRARCDVTVTPTTEAQNSTEIDQATTSTDLKNVATEPMQTTPRMTTQKTDTTNGGAVTAEQSTTTTGYTAGTMIKEDELSTSQDISTRKTETDTTNEGAVTTEQLASTVKTTEYRAGRKDSTYATSKQLTSTSQPTNEATTTNEFGYIRWGLEIGTTTHENVESTSREMSTATTANDTSVSSTNDGASSPAIAECAPDVSNDTCNVFHDGKCFYWTIGNFQDVSLSKANTSCLDEGFQLGNIYNDDEYELVTQQVLNDVTFGQKKLWTGMTLKDGTIYSSMGEVLTLGDVWGDDNPDSGNYISIQVSSFPPPGKRGLFNINDKKDGGSDEKLAGTFCSCLLEA